MDKVRRNERMAALTMLLTASPNRIFTLSHFAKLFGAGKSTVSDDVKLLQGVLSAYGLGKLDTVTGAAGGVRYRPELTREDARGFIAQLCKELSDPSRLLIGGFLYLADILAQPRIARNLQDASGNIIERFEPEVTRTLVMPQGDQLPVLFLQEDMLLHGENSLACRCEPDSGYYDEDFCNSVDLDNYTAQFDRDPNLDDEITDIVRYRVHVPDGYRFNRGVCDQEQIDRHRELIAARVALANLTARTDLAEGADDDEAAEIGGRIAELVSRCEPGELPPGAESWSLLG